MGPNGSEPRAMTWDPYRGVEVGQTWENRRTSRRSKVLELGQFRTSAIPRVRFRAVDGGQSEDYAAASEFVRRYRLIVDE